MPVPSRTHRAEAKYNVTTEFPHLGLHAAAATGNVGLVKYALSHGQPVNSVLNGVLPLHAACAGGDELVVRLLIEHGADVNAPRLPLRYSPDKSRSSTIVGTSGSTPLHFAAANNHTSVARVLLQHGAHPARPDKHGVLPAELASGECADVINGWAGERERDLDERQQLRATPSTPALALPQLSSTTTPDPSPTRNDAPVLPLGSSYLFNPSDRRPSFPASESPPSTRRPRSAGNGAEKRTRKLSSKYSLLNLFRKAQGEEDGGKVCRRDRSASRGQEDAQRPQYMHHHHHSSSSSNANANTQVPPLPPTPATAERPGILLDHHRSSSGSGLGTRQLRFDASQHASSSNLRKQVEPSSSAVVDGDDDDEEEYGRPLEKDVSALPFNINAPPPEPEDASPSILMHDEGRSRGDSTSTAPSTLSPPMHPSFSRTSSSTSSSSALSMTSTGPGLAERRAHPPLDIDIKAAEALVAQRQQEVFDLSSSSATTIDEASAEEGREKKKAIAKDLLHGRTPLSARLAAYGESLAIERRVKREEAERERAAANGVMPETPTSSDSNIASTPASSRAPPTPHTPGTSTPIREPEPGNPVREPSTPISSQRSASRIGAANLDRKFSLEQRAPDVLARPTYPRVRTPRRPNTAGGTPSRDMLTPPRDRSSSDQFRAGRPHQLSRSTSHSPDVTAELAATLRPFPYQFSSHAASQSRIPDAPVGGGEELHYTSPRYAHASPGADMRAMPLPSSDTMRSTPEEYAPDHSDLLDSSERDHEKPAMSAALARVLGAPADEMCTVTLRERDPERARLASASKLTRMGFDPARSAGASPGSASVGGKRSFGIRSLVRGLKGKS